MAARSATGGESAKTFFTPIEQWYNVLTASGATPAEGLARRGHDYVTDVFNTVSGKVADAMPWSWRALEATLAGNGNWLQKRLTKGQRDWVEATLRDHGPFSHLHFPQGLIAGLVSVPSQFPPWRVCLVWRQRRS